MLNVFYGAYTILGKVYGGGAYLKQAMLDVQIDPRDRAAVTKLCYGVLDRDIYLTDKLERLCDKKPKLAVRTVLKIAMYSITFLKKAPYAVTDTAVELCNRLGKKGVAGFVNAFLRRYIQTDFPEPEDITERLSLKYDYPPFVVRDLVGSYGSERAEKIMSADGERTCVRFEGVDGEEYLRSHGLDYTATPYENIFFADKFTRNSDYDDGIYTYQSIGSAAVVEALGSGDRLLDCCAAPGGKSVFAAKRFHSVTSQELHPHRAELIKEYAARMKRNNIEVVVGDATVFCQEYEGKFDAVLCDVPCSGFGVMKGAPDIKLKKSEENIKELCDLQLSILENCSRYVAKGGRLVYSTCSFLKEENDGVVSRFLTSRNEFMSEIISVKIPYNKTNFGVQLLPDISFGAGFYISALKRIK